MTLYVVTIGCSKWTLNLVDMFMILYIVYHMYVVLLLRYFLLDYPSYNFWRNTNFICYQYHPVIGLIHALKYHTFPIHH